MTGTLRTNSTNAILTMNEKEAENSQRLAEMIIQRGRPDKDSETQLFPLSLSSVGMRKSNLADLLDCLTPVATKSRREQDLLRFRANIQSILLGAVASAFSYRWLAISTRNENLKEDGLLGQFKFSRRRVEKILALLLDEGWLVMGRKGYLGKGTGNRRSKSSQYFAGDKLIRLFTSCLYEFDGAMELPTYHKFKDFSVELIPSPDTYDANEHILRRYNQHMSEHSWAMKGPTIRTFNETVCRGGRLYNRFQNLANRRIPLRKSTLIDGCPIAEPDFSCNHLRMAAALSGHELPADPYSALIEQVGGDPKKHRDVAKQFFTSCIGAKEIKQKNGMMTAAAKLPDKTKRIRIVTYKNLLEATNDLYPWIESNKIFFNDRGSQLQKYEGDIALKMIEWSVNENIPLLPVHDSFAVRNIDEERTRIMMDISWNQVVSGARLYR